MSGFGLRAVLAALVGPLFYGMCAAGTVTPRPADSFVDSIGINIHAAFPNIPYDQNWQGVINAVGDIGFRYVRDIPDRPDRLNPLVEQTGTKLVIIAQHWATRVDATNMDNYDITLERIRTLKNIALFEGPNEMDGPIDPLWAQHLKDWYLRMYADVKADANLQHIPWIAPSLSNPHSHQQITELAPYIDYGNVHVYPGGWKPLNSLQGKLDLQAVLGGNKPVIATETGYFTAPQIVYSMYNYGVSEIAQAKYLPRLYFDYFSKGIAKTIGYELVDYYYGNDGNYHLGILRTDFSYKPAAHALKNLITLLEDAGPDFAAKPVNLTLSGGNADLRHNLLQKYDGDYWLALWQDALIYDYVARKDISVPSVATTVTVDRPILFAQSFVPRLSTDPTSIPLVAGQTQLTLNVGDEVMLLALRLADYGDTNLDGIVNFPDFVTLFENFGGPGNWATGDFTGDGMVGFPDYQRLALWDPLESTCRHASLSIL